jgi:SsrA-binding protein
MKTVREQAKEPPAVRTPTLENRRARFEFEILESLEAGLALTGTEIKSLREGGGSLGEA